MPFYIPRIDKTFALVPVIEGISPRKKSYGIASDLRNLFKYFTIPFVIADEFQSPRQLLFQFNITLDSDFYLLNVEQYRIFTTSVVAGGCLCIKYRIGTAVYRYKLVDHRSDDWSFFIPYSNQLIKKNFCIEFWGDNLLPSEEFFNRGILQDIVLQTSRMYTPTVADESPIIEQLDLEESDNGLKIFIPVFFPVDNSICVWLDNI